MPFDRAIFLADADVGLPGVEWHQIPSLSSREDYSRFVVKDLARYIETSHVLLIQWDGYIANPSAWTDEFLEYDYIGAPWGFHQDDHRVGNGGFSLRSKRLLDALSDPEIAELDPEDEAICRRYRPLLEERYGIRFAPESLAARFSFETTYPDGIPFGFHGLFNIWMHLSDSEFDDFLALLTPAILGSPQLLQLGRNYKDLGKRREAAAILKRRLEILPDDRESRSLLAGLEPRPAPTSRNSPCPCGSGKRYKECCGLLTGQAPASRSAPSTDDLLREAMRYHQAGNLSTAQALYQQILKQAPEHAMALHYLGVIQMQFGKLEEAERLIRKSLEAGGDIPDFHNNLGLCLRAMHRLEEAIPCYRQALQVRADYVVAHNNLGLDLQQLGRLEEARQAFEDAIRLKPDFAEAHWNLGLLLLLTGEFERGWVEYEWRLRCPQFTRGASAMPPGMPIWQGEPLQDKRILVLHEQGAGDNFQFVRLMPMLARLGARVVLETLADQADLLCHVEGVSECLTKGAAIPEVDYCIHTLSLPGRLGVGLDESPGGVPYLAAPSALREAWRTRLADIDDFKIGVVWAGNPTHANDHNRSCPLQDLAPLFELPGIRWFSLQKGKAADQRQALPPGLMTDVAGDLANYGDTAALIEALDLVISVDTSVAHLAGALDRPCWVMLPFAPDFRWQMARDDCPWYPSIRLFRQKEIGNWREVAERIAKDLRVHAQSGSHV